MKIRFCRAYHPRRFQRCSASGFTLVELLVVIAIISILAAMLLPALDHARESACRVRCVGNLRQMGMSVQTYAGDFDDIAPPASPAWPATGWGVHGIWVSLWFNDYYGLGMLYGNDYMQAPRLYYCPSNSHDTNPYPMTWDSAYGWRDGTFGPWVVSTYAYRSSFDDGSGYRAADLARDEGGMCLAADFFLKRVGLDCHVDGYSALYIDGSARFIADDGTIEDAGAPVGDTYYGTIEPMWRTHFDRQ